MTDPAATITITMATRPDPARYAHAVLAIERVLQLAGLTDTAVWPDGTVTDEEIAALHDKAVNASQWA